MRLRRKKNLDKRLNAVSNLIIITDNELKNELLAIQDKKYIDFKSVFGNHNKVELEIGCGKGQFILEKALKNPNVNFLGVELLSNVIMLAAERVASKNEVKNVKFINSGAAYLQRYFPSKSVSNIYLNFSPPFPEFSHENRRLTNLKHIEIYKDLLAPNGKIFQKTDNLDFFNYSKRKFSEAGLKVIDNSAELMEGKIDNIETEYEQKFRALNMPIYSLIAYFK